MLGSKVVLHFIPFKVKQPFFLRLNGDSKSKTTALKMQQYSSFRSKSLYQFIQNILFYSKHTVFSNLRTPNNFMYLCSVPGKTTAHAGGPIWGERKAACFALLK